MNERRVFKLFHYLDQGLAVEEIIAREERGRLGQERGLDSEYRVLKVLRNLADVAAVQGKSRKPNREPQGFDFIVQLKKTSELDLKSVKVEVKSSTVGILSYKKSLRRRRGIAAEELNFWLGKNRLVLINGQDSPEKIAQDFLSQVERIREIYKILNEDS